MGLERIERSEQGKPGVWEVGGRKTYNRGKHMVSKENQEMEYCPGAFLIIQFSSFLRDI